MKHILFALLTLPAIVVAQDPINCWVPWSCNEDYGPLPVGHHRAIMQFDSPPGGHLVMYSITTAIGTSWDTLGLREFGRHILDLTYESPDPNDVGYSQSYTVALAFIDDGNEATVSSPLSFTTEPAPEISIDLSASAGVASCTVSTAPSGNLYFGEVYGCFPITIDIVATDQAGTTLFEGPGDYVPGEPFSETITFPYGITTERICVTATMRRSSTSEPVFDFMVTNTQHCEDIDITTSVVEADGTSVRAPYPNPFTDRLVIPAPTWHAFDLLGKSMISGSNSETIETTSWPTGTYVIRTSTGTHLVVKQ